MANSINFVTLVGLVVDKKITILQYISYKIYEEVHFVLWEATCWWNSCFNRDIRVCS